MITSLLLKSFQRPKNYPFWIAMAACLQHVLTMLILQQPVSWSYTVIVTLLTFTAYAYYYHYALKYVFMCTVISIIGMLVFTSIETSAGLTIVACLTLLYSFSFRQKTWGFRNLYLMKNILIVMCWISVTAIIPCYTYTMNTATHVLWKLFSSQALLLFMLTILVDQAHACMDKEQGLKTIPLWLGKTYTNVLILALVVGFLIFNFFYVQDLGLNYMFTNMVVAYFIIHAVLVPISLLKIDGIMVIQFLVWCVLQTLTKW